MGDHEGLPGGGLLELGLTEWWVMDKNRYECSVTVKGDRKSTEVKLSRQAIPLIRMEGALFQLWVERWASAAWKTVRLESRLFCILRGYGGPANVWSPLYTQSQA